MTCQLQHAHSYSYNNQFKKQAQNHSHKCFITHSQACNTFLAQCVCIGREATGQWLSITRTKTLAEPLCWRKLHNLAQFISLYFLLLMTEKENAQHRFITLGGLQTEVIYCKKHTLSYTVKMKLSFFWNKKSLMKTCWTLPENKTSFWNGQSCKCRCKNTSFQSFLQ